MSAQITKKEYIQDRSLTRPVMCEYGCCNPALKYFPTTDKWCCSENAKCCSANKQKVKLTVQNKYGVDNISQLRSIKLQKKNTYNVNDIVKQESIKTKREKSCIEKYGVKNPSQNKSVKEKRNNTFLENYGGHPLADDNLIAQRKRAMIEKYGVDNFGKTSEHTVMIAEYNASLSEEERTQITDKILKTKFDQGIITDPELKSDFETYYNAVRNLSDRNYKKHKII